MLNVNLNLRAKIIKIYRNNRKETTRLRQIDSSKKKYKK